MLRSIKSRGAIGRISYLRHCSKNGSLGIGIDIGGVNVNTAGVDVDSVIRRLYLSKVLAVDRGASLSPLPSIQHREHQHRLLQKSELERLHHRCVNMSIASSIKTIHAPSCTAALRSLPIQQSVRRYYHQCHQHRHRQRQSRQHPLPHLRMHPPTSTIINSSQQRRNKVFVSRHNQTLNLTSHSIISFILAHLPHLNLSGDDFRITSSHVILKECPFCSKPTNGKMDNMYKLYVSIGGGAYFCHRCGCKGSWYDFKNEISGGFIHESSASSSSPASSVPSTNTSTSPVHVNGKGNSVARFGVTSQHSQQSPQDGTNMNNNNNHTIPSPLPMPPKKLNSVYINKLFDPTNSSTVNPKEHHALNYLTYDRGLNKSVLLKYGVGCAQYNFPSTIKQESSGNSNSSNIKHSTEETNKSKIGYVSSMCVTFPWLMRASEVAELEELRGSKFVWKENCDDAAVTTTAAATTKRMTNNEGKHISEMSPLEKHHFRKLRKTQSKAMPPQHQPQQHPQVGEEVIPTANNNSINKQEMQDQEVAGEEDIEKLLYGPYITRRIKVRSVEQKSWQRLDPPGGGFGLFGWHTVPHNASQLIITEGEFDAMAVYQATGRPAVSLPNGCRSFPTELLVLLEKFDTIYLWMDNDGPGREGAEMFARKLGVERCLLVQPSGKRGWNGTDGASGVSTFSSSSDNASVEAGGAASMPTPLPPKDANEALLMNWNLNELLDEARELPHEKILRFSDLRDQVSSVCTVACIYHLKLDCCLIRNRIILLQHRYSGHT